MKIPFWPSLRQWRGWSLPSKLTLVGLVIAFVAFAWQIFFPAGSALDQKGTANVQAGRDIKLEGDLVMVAPDQGLLESPAGKCRVVASVESRIISRLYARKDLRATPEAKVDFSFQELFYEWKLTLSSDKPVKQVSGRVDYLKGDDRFRLVPEDTTLSRPFGKWFSNFPEPARKVPDYFARTFEVGVTKDRPVEIAIRRPLATPVVSEVDVIRLGDLRSLDCLVDTVTTNAKTEAARLSRQATALAQWTYSPAQGGAGLPIRGDPGDVASEDVQATVEAWCQTDSCDSLMISKLEVHMGKPPKEYFKSGGAP